MKLNPRYLYSGWKRTPLIEFMIISFGFLQKRRKADFPFFRFTCILLLLAQFLTAETALLASGIDFIRSNRSSAYAKTFFCP